MKKSIIALNVIVFLFLLGINGKVSGQDKEVPTFKLVYHVSIPDGCQDPTGYQVFITLHRSTGSITMTQTFTSPDQILEFSYSSIQIEGWFSISTNVPGVSFEFFDGSIPSIGTTVYRNVVGICSLEPDPGFEM